MNLLAFFWLLILLLLRVRRYLVGLLFTLKTHSHLFENPEEEEGEGGGHEVPDAWSHTHAHAHHAHA
jgi:Ca2+/H+ antiporter